MKIAPSLVTCALLLLAPSLALSQSKQATVKADSLAVYSEMSSEDDPVATLPQGTAVRVLIAVTGDPVGDWCGIANQGSSARIGYVLCAGLDRPKQVLSAADLNAPPPEMIIGGASSALQSSKRSARVKATSVAGGRTLGPLSGYDWGSYSKTLVIAIRTGCPYCDASMPFYRRLGERERSSRLRAHLLLVMPNDPATGAQYLAKGGLDSQSIFGQSLGALRVSGTPTLLLLDSGGRVERTWVGQLTAKEESEVMRAAE